jgi:hypothetical protein
MYMRVVILSFVYRQRVWHRPALDLGHSLGKVTGKIKLLSGRQFSRQSKLNFTIQSTVRPLRFVGSSPIFGRSGGRGRCSGLRPSGHIAGLNVPNLVASLRLGILAGSGQIFSLSFG